jgi:hypothetical protein
MLLVMTAGSAMSLDAHSQAKSLPDVYKCRVLQYFMQGDDGRLSDLLISPKTSYVEQTKNASFLANHLSHPPTESRAAYLTLRFSTPIGAAPATPTLLCSRAHGHQAGWQAADGHHATRGISAARRVGRGDRQVGRGLWRVALRGHASADRGGLEASTEAVIASAQAETSSPADSHRVYCFASAKVASTSIGAVHVYDGGGPGNRSH